MLKAVFVAAALAAVFAAQPTVYAVSASDSIAGNACNYIQKVGSVEGCKDGKTLEGSGGTLATVVNTFLYAAGIVAFLFVLIAGIRYINTTGDPSRIQQAKDTLLYAIIGLIITLLAIPIAGFVIRAVSK